MITIKHFPSGTILLLNSLLYSVSLNSVNTEERHIFPEIMEQVAKIVHLKEMIARAHKETTLIYHSIGKHILECEAQYGWTIKQTLGQLSQNLHVEFPALAGLSSRSLQYIRKFAKEYPDQEWVKEVVAHLPWAHIESILGRVREKNDQIFYIKKALESDWSRNTLVMQIRSGLHKKENLATAQAQATESPAHGGKDTSDLK